MNEDSGRWPPGATRGAPASGIEEALRQSQEQFRSVVAAVSDYAIYLLDPTGVIVSWNTGAERIKGYAAQEIVGRHFSVFYPPEAVAANFPAAELKIAREQGHFEDEGWRVRRDGSRFWASVVITALSTASGELRGFLKITRDLTRRRESEEQLRAAREELEARVTERTAELERVVAQLREQDRSKDQFLAVLGHELRNPLAPIRSGIEILRDRWPGPEQAARVLSILDRQTAHLTRLLDDLLDMARLTRRAITIERRRFDLRQAAGDAADAVRPLAEQRGQQLDIRLPADPVLVTGDAARLTQVFGNLLHNASKFTPREGRIELTMTSDAQDVQVTVVDTGLGLEAHEMPRLFDTFVQLERPGTTQTGLGLGLSLARHMVELHGGTIQACSPGRGQGSTFRVRLPAESAVAHAPTGDGGVSPVLRRRVLIVDDNVDAVETMGLFLSQSGHDVRSAFDGEAALGTAREFTPDVVLLDIGMPGLSGYEIAAQLRQLPFGAGLVLIAITGWGQPGDRERAQQAGFDYHLTKPADPASIQQIVVAGRPRQFTAIGNPRR
jgi:PAS domain S-box-containing protein